MHGVAEKVIEFFAILKENAALATALRFLFVLYKKKRNKFCEKSGLSLTVHIFSCIIKIYEYICML